MPNAPAAPSLKALSQDAGVSRTYYSIAEVAAMLGVSRVSVWRWISSGRLPVSRLGHRTVRVKRDDLLKIVRPSRRGSGPTSQGAPASPDAAEASSADHFVLFYEVDSFLVDAVVDFVGPALKAGERAIVVATPAHRAGIEDGLRADGIDVTQVLADGTYLAVDAAHTLARFLMEDVPDPVRFEAVLQGLLRGSTGNSSRPRIFGEMVALLVAEGKAEGALALEALWNWQAKKHHFALMCAYPMQQLGGEALTSVLVDVCTEHSTVVPTESYSALESGDARLRAIAALQQKAASLEQEIAERRRVEEQLQVALSAEKAARVELEAALRVREEFLSIASHELRTPITVLTAQAQLSLRRLERTGGLDPERVGLALRMMRSQADKLGRLVGQLLDVARLDSGKLQLEPQPTNLALVVEQVVAAARSLVEDTHTISLTGPDLVECDVDALRLEQVLTNLIDNAVKYSPEGGSVDVVLTQPNRHMVEVSVRDYGLGIPAEKLDHIFDRFYQAHDSSYRSGMGLGLYVCREIVQLHGGEIHAECPPDGGTRLVVRLPVARASTHAARAAD